MGPEAPFACLTSDIVRSREAPDRAALQCRIEAALARVNESLRGQLAVPLAVTVGDEWQGLFTCLEAALEADLVLRGALAPEVFATGIGVGGLATPLAGRTADMDGPCFHRARGALERAKRRGSGGVAVDSGDPGLDLPVNTICHLLSALSSRWTEKQLRAVLTYRERGTELAAAEALGISQPVLHRSLAGARGREFLEAYRQLLAFVRGYPGGPREEARAP
ncbi:MAG: SatD family protein [Deferrisomatales bacterium]|nr:SatD family protein [Deferrisomatales bacterium]